MTASQRRSRRLGLTALACLSVSASDLSAAEKLSVSLDYVFGVAQEVAKKPFRSPRADLPTELKASSLDYDKWREIRFIRDQALWKKDNLPFWAEFFHPGYIYEEPVQLTEFSQEGYAQPIRFAPDFFDYAAAAQPFRGRVKPDTGYAGVRFLYPLNKSDAVDELGAFLGASYFRFISQGSLYGMSARGLAIDTGEGDRPEEFPIFTHFWLGKPAPGAKELVMFALLDSVSTTGAYQFTIKPGATTVIDVESILCLREPATITAASADKKPLRSLGIAPLTSMFWFGENSERKFDDYRPEVHDSDGLLMAMGSGEMLWRPLNNAKELRHSLFATTSPKGFGLLQRDREAANYQEIFTLYQQRPSVWIQPKGDWGEGVIHLVELSTKDEYLDNVVAYWDPKVKPEPLKAYRFGYQMQWRMGTERELSPNYCKATRAGAALHNSKVRQFALDFTGPALEALTEADPPVAVASCSPNAHFSENQVKKNPIDGTWRVILKLEPAADNLDPVDLRVTLKKGETTLTETWTYLWSPL
jgi:periplasmic glucans biosynthesis protein